MRLSELSTDEMLNKICLLTPHIEEIVKDKDIRKVLTETVQIAEGQNEEEVGIDKGIEKIVKLIPILLQDHRQAIYNVLAILNNVEVKQIAEQTLIITIKQLKELLNDKELIELFT